MKFSLIALIATASAVRLSVLQPGAGGLPQEDGPPATRDGGPPKGGPRRGPPKGGPRRGPPADGPDHDHVEGDSDGEEHDHDDHDHVDGDSDGDNDGPDGPGKLDALFKQCDGDENGNLTWEEATACGAPAEIHDAFMANAGVDGVLNKAELIALFNS